MAKREIINVDENIIKKMIAGDIPTQPFEKLNQPQANQEESYQIEPEQIDENPVKPIRRKKSRIDYKDIFLIRQRNTSYRQTTIILGEDIYSGIQKILKVADGLTIANFINNVLRQHFAEYKDEIMELRRNFMSDLFNDEDL